MNIKIFSCSLIVTISMVSWLLIQPGGIVLILLRGGIALLSLFTMIWGVHRKRSKWLIYPIYIVLMLIMGIIAERGFQLMNLHCPKLLLPAMGLIALICLLCIARERKVKKNKDQNRNTKPSNYTAYLN